MTLHWSIAIPQAMQQHGGPPKGIECEPRSDALAQSASAPQMIEDTADASFGRAWAVKTTPDADRTQFLL